MLTDIIYDDLKKKIINLSLKPGTALSFANLKPEYNVSISPIRDALKKLEAEGLVDIKPQSGTAVALIDMSHVEDERFRRLFLELGAVEQTFESGYSDSFIEQFKKLIIKQEEAFKCRDSELFLSLDDRMHRLFFERCKHQNVFDDTMDSSGNYRRIRMVSYLFDDVFKCSLDQHEEILKALEEHNFEKTMALERAHISRIENETVEYRATYPQYFRV